MAFNATRAELTATIEELHRVQMEAIKDATFGGWTRESEDAFEMRSSRIAALVRKLTLLDGTGK
jgi:hypothetical protein